MRTLKTHGNILTEEPWTWTSVETDSLLGAAIELVPLTTTSSAGVDSAAGVVVGVWLLSAIGTIGSGALVEGVLLLTTVCIMGVSDEQRTIAAGSTDILRSRKKLPFWGVCTTGGTELVLSVYIYIHYIYYYMYGYPSK
jgi:hypothetical protein